MINEWNGYYKYDRSVKYTGLEAFNGMTINDLHSLIQITPDMDLMTDVMPGETLEIPLWLSVLTDKVLYENVKVNYQIQHIDITGKKTTGSTSTSQIINMKPWQMEYIDPLKITVPENEGILVVNIILEPDAGDPVHKNFVLFRIDDKENDPNQTLNINGSEHFLLSFKPGDYSSSDWSKKEWNILDGKKVNGSGYGFFEYEIDIPDNLISKEIKNATFKVELSAKQLYGKDRTDTDEMEGDYMRGQGTHDPSRNPNAYPMTDEDKWTSYVRLIINDVVVDEVFLSDDPADHMGILSWHSQLRDKKLREAGSYGYLISSTLPEKTKIILIGVEFLGCAIIILLVKKSGLR